MSEFVQCLLILSIFLGFIFALICEYAIKVRDKDKHFTAYKDKRKYNKKK